MQLAKMRREESGLDRMMSAIRAKGGPSDPMVAAQAMIDSEIPHFMDTGFKLQAAARQRTEDMAAMGLSPTAAPAAAAPVSEAYPGYNESIGMPAPVNALAPAVAAPAPVNAMAPAAAAPSVNAMAPSADREAQIRSAKLKMLSPTAGVRDVGKLELEKLTSEAPDAGLMRQLGYPLTQAGYQAFRDAQRQERMLSPAEEAQRARIAAASRAPVQPVAPTITQIVDPTNPNQMITIDARRYQSGGAGSPGVIGVAGKEPGAALRQNKVEAGKTQLADDLENLRESFKTLDRMRAIPSTERNVLSNIGSATAATGLGQKTGQFFGTEAQVERDVINSARTRLVNSIKNATGMSAQQLNSNVELQTMLKSISDPGQSVQAAMRIIGDIEDAYVKGDGKMPKRGAPAAANVVVTPDGQSHTFPTPAAAAEFKKAAGL
jgi:hypothetical protein